MSKARELFPKTQRQALYEDQFEGLSDLRQALASASELIAHTAGEKFSAECKGSVALVTNGETIVLEIRSWPSSGSHERAGKMARESLQRWIDTSLLIGGMIVLVALAVLAVNFLT